MTELDKRIQEIAALNWNQFVSLIGEDAITKAKICLLRQNNKSYGEISNKLGITERQARYGCSNCTQKPEFP
jgi:hypothetical protein